jgi:hypothetical protein
MKRLTVLTLAAVWVGGASAGRAADVLPLPTGLAPTTPRVPAPVARNGVVVAATGTTAPSAGAVQLAGFWNRPQAGFAATENCRTPQVWCTDCAPAVRHPLPPLPAFAACGTTGAACLPADRDGSCWERFKDWFCFRLTPARLPLTPTPRMTPLYTYFPCNEKAGCATGNCGPGGYSGHPRLGGFAPARGCTTCPQPAEAVMPGYRFAAPTNTAPAAPVPAPLNTGEVIPSGYRVPAASVPYRPLGGSQPAPGVQPATR